MDWNLFMNIDVMIDAGTWTHTRVCLRTPYLLSIVAYRLKHCTSFLDIQHRIYFHRAKSFCEDGVWYFLPRVNISASRIMSVLSNNNANEILCFSNQISTRMLQVYSNEYHSLIVDHVRDMCKVIHPTVSASLQILRRGIIMRLVP